MHALERELLSASVRHLLMRRYEAPAALSFQLPDGATVLEIGCGAGIGALLIQQRFTCSRLVALDIDPVMVERTRRMLDDPPRWARDVDTGGIEVMVGDATSLPFPDGSFDAVVQFFVLDHIPSWPKAIDEAYRVLKSGGTYAAEEALLPRCSGDSTIPRAMCR
jgi:ubiquinone/menaquinone biosynthesis C-methylase UbiE